MIWPTFEAKRVWRYAEFTLWTVLSEQGHWVLTRQSFNCGHVRLLGVAALPRLKTATVSNSNDKTVYISYDYNVRTSSLATRPRVSSLTSNNSGVSVPFFCLPRPSPGFQPIFCSKCIPIPLLTGAAVWSWS